MSINFINKKQTHQKGETVRQTQMLPNYKNHLNMLHEAYMPKIITFLLINALSARRENERKRYAVFKRNQEFNPPRESRKRPQTTDMKPVGKTSLKLRSLLFSPAQSSLITKSPPHPPCQLSCRPQTAGFCIDGWNFIEQAKAAGRSTIRCHIFHIAQHSDTELAIRKVAIRVMPQGGKCSYAELVRNTHHLYQALYGYIG